MGHPPNALCHSLTPADSGHAAHATPSRPTPSAPQRLQPRHLSLSAPTPPAAYRTPQIRQPHPAPGPSALSLSNSPANPRANAPGAYDLWIAALVLLGLSFALAIRALRHKGAEDTGPPVARLREERATHAAHRLRETMLEDLTKEVRANDRALARKAVLFDQALTPLVLAILTGLAGRL